MTTVSAAATTAGSELARNPPATMAATSASVRSSMCDVPALRLVTIRSEVSRPVTSRPRATASWASGTPT
jgi:hypothetical protein